MPDAPSLEALRHCRQKLCLAVLVFHPHPMRETRLAGGNAVVA